MVVESPFVLGLQIGNFTINMVFLILFIYRFVVLRSFARTQRYRDYFPKLRIFFSLVYVVVNAALLVETVIFNQLSAVDMVLVVVGEGINSFILFIQLLVLRLQLLKEQPYTWFHLAYFLYLCLFSALRFVILIFIRTQEQDAVNITLSSVLIVDSVAQFAYWVIKKQSLPQFQVHTHAEIDSFRNHSKLLHNVLDSDRSLRRDSLDTFPYIIPFVSVDNGRIKIIIQSASPSPPNTEQNDTGLLAAPKTSFAASKRHSLNRATRSQESNNEISTQILSCSYYSSEEIKNLYVVCSRFPMQKNIDFHSAALALPDMAKQLQEFLSELFRERRWYHPSVLKYLRISLDRLKEYSQLLEKIPGSSKENEMDKTLGLRVVDDKNGMFFSVSIYKHLWVDDHYEFYLKVVDRHHQLPYYPIKRFSEFQDFHNALRQRIKAIGKDMQLPLLPKKHLFTWNEDQINQRRAELERYMRLLANDHIILGVSTLKELVFEFLGAEESMGEWGGVQYEGFYGDEQVVKGEVSKCLIGKDLVTYYEFKIFKRGIEVCLLSKRFSEFEQLHRELERWMHNIQINYKAVALPERHYYKSESIRHEKLKNYLQAVVDIREARRVYAVNSFFNVAGSDNDDISEIGYNSRQMERSQNQSHVMNEVIELVQTLHRPPPERLSESSQESSRRFSKIINNLGDPEFD